MAFGGFAPLPLRLGGSAEEGVSPEQHARLAADLLATKFACPFAVWTYTKTGASATIHDYWGQNGVGLAYAPTATPSIFAGVTGFGWPAGVFTDPYGAGYPFTARKARITPHGTAEMFGTYQLNFGSLALVVSTFDSADSPIDCKVTVRIW